MFDESKIVLDEYEQSIEDAETFVPLSAAEQNELDAIIAAGNEETAKQATFTVTLDPDIAACLRAAHKTPAQIIGEWAHQAIAKTATL